MKGLRNELLQRLFHTLAFGAIENGDFDIQEVPDTPNVD